MKTKQLCRWSKEKGRKEKQKQGEKKKQGKPENTTFSTRLERCQQRASWSRWS
jgi:hypothetical protein